MTWYSPPTQRRTMTKARATRIFVAADGICCVCGCRIRDGEDWEIEHPDELADGGSDDDADLRPVHLRCHRPKTAKARAVRAKRNRIITAGYVGKPRKSRPLPGTRASGLRRRMNGNVEHW